MSGEVVTETVFIKHVHTTKFGFFSYHFKVQTHWYLINMTHSNVNLNNQRQDLSLKIATISLLIDACSMLDMERCQTLPGSRLLLSSVETW